ncbi:MAG TPA: NUDIX domain-containing protein [Candidatus Saccharimonadales bacterium]|nr:NUDIX domain-containing protein [Candidatus Saccharimonadales bacterium]
MKPFLTIDETSIDPNSKTADRNGYGLREAARALVVDNKGAVALLHVRNKNYYKLPGGGIEGSEAVEDALAREILEEIGCKAEIITGLGSIQEYRYFWNMNQISYCYLAKVVGEKGESNFTADERADGFKVVWASSLDKAIQLLKGKGETADPGIVFMRMRDVAIAEKARLYL